VGSRLLISRVVLKLCASYLAILVVLLVGLDIAAYGYLARLEHDALQPILAQPEGRAAYAGVMRGVAVRLALFDVPLLILAGGASYALATLSVRPLVAAREREARFASEAAHELRTPLARIAGLAQSAGDADDSGRRASLERIEAIALDASRTVGDLLSLVREERLSPRLAEPVDLCALARTVAAAARRDAIAFEVASNDECWVVGDERRLRRLIENLVDNAARHARTVVRLGATVEGDRVALAVEDDGDGVPPALRERIFERFVRGDEDEAGSGLGLSICRSIARAHGGDVVLEERNRFVTRLPRLDPKGA
jgi:signal transduction histidine kinase